jgi:hypothetical protein
MNNKENEQNTAYNTRLYAIDSNFMANAHGSIMSSRYDILVDKSQFSS